MTQPKVINPSTGVATDIAPTGARMTLTAQPRFIRSYPSTLATLPYGCRYRVKGGHWHFISQTEFLIERLEGWVVAITGKSAAAAKKLREQGGRQALVDRLLQDPGLDVYVEKGRRRRGHDRLCLDPEAGNEAEYGARGLWVGMARVDPAADGEGAKDAEDAAWDP